VNEAPIGGTKRCHEYDNFDFDKDSDLFQALEIKILIYNYFSWALLQKVD